MEKILGYHSIGDTVKETGAGLYCVPVAAFREQMEWVRKMGTVPASVSRTIGAGWSGISEKCPDLTFDDGDITNYTKAYPVLKELGLKAYFFIIGEWVGKPGYMDWDQIRELKSYGMTIGSHGMTHRLLTTLSDAELEYELVESKKLLEGTLKAPITSLSIPRGFYNKRVLDRARAAGYTEIFDSKERIVVRADWDMERFVDMLNGKYSWQQKAWDFVTYSSKKLLGDDNYDRVRTKILNLKSKTVDHRPKTGDHRPETIDRRPETKDL